MEQITRLLFLAFTFSSTSINLFSQSQDECKIFSISNFVGYSVVGNDDACHWKFEDYFLHIPSFSGGQLCQVGGNGNPCILTSLSANSAGYYDITCNIPIGKVVKICGDECLDITLNGSPVADCSPFYVEQAPVTSIVVKGTCSTPVSTYFEVCDPYLRHYYVFDGENITLAFAFLNPSSEPVEFKVATDGTQCSKFALNLTTLKLRVKEDPDSQGPKDVYGLLEQGSKPGEYLYTHPVYIPDGGNQTFHLEVLNEDNQVLKEIPLKLYRPPVLTLHGFGGRRDKFNDLTQKLQSDFEYEDYQITLGGYEATSGQPFPQNAPVLTNQILEGIDKMVKEKIATGKIDVIGHSMGGLVARSYLAQSGSNNKINKLITIATPHAGSQIANVLHDPDFQSSTIPSITAGAACLNFDGCGPGTGMNSLRVESEELSALNNTPAPAPSHAIAVSVIYNGNDLSDNLSVELSAVASMMDISLPLLLAVFNGQPNDGVVTVNSQYGGLSGNATSIFSSIDHLQAPFNLQVISWVGQLLKENPHSNLFAQSGFASSIETYNDNLTPTPNNNAVGQIEINSPLPGQIVNWGESLEFNIIANGFSPSSIKEIRVALFNDAKDGSNSATIQGGQGSASLLMNGRYLGKTKGIVFAKNTENKTVAVKTFEILVNITETPSKVLVNPGFHDSLEVGETIKFRVDAFFEYFRSEISDLPGITYTFNNNKAEYIGGNIIKALETGTTEMTVSFHGISSNPVPITIVAPDSTSSLPPGIYQENMSRLELNIHPNPATDMIHIKAAYSDALWLQIYDILGRILISKKVGMTNGMVDESVNISDLRSGVYFIVLKGIQGDSITKFIKG